MDEFGYPSVLLSIIPGLAITKILKGMAVLVTAFLFGFEIALLFARLR